MRRFVQEAKTASALNHPNIITIYEIEKIDSVNFIATEFIDGETLRHRMKGAPMTFDEVLDVAIQTASGEIVSGQGTRSIKVVAPDWSSLTASLSVIGLPTQCAGVTASMTVFREHVPTAQLFDQFGSAPFAKVRPRLDNFAEQLRNQPGAMGFILVNGEWGLAEGAKSYLVTQHGIEAERIVNVRKKRSRRLIIKLYIVPAGAIPPAV